jgi:hypothetical protein
MTRGRTVAWLAALAVAAPLVLVPAPAQAATAAKPFDFDGDGDPELVVGAPDLPVGGHLGAGGVTWEMSHRLTADEAVLTQSTSGVPGASEDGDHFGAAIASGDFDRDGYADLAVGQPGEDGSKAKGSGAITVLYGSPDGPTGKGAARFAQPKEERDAAFGSALATGDLNGDGYADLVVGAPGDDNADPKARFPDTGTVTVLYGSKDGIRSKHSTVLRGVRGSDGDYQFGSALRVADVDADGRPDVVVVASGRENRDGYAASGSVSFCSGGTAGPSGCQRLGGDETGGRYASVVVGDVAGGPGAARPEIVVGVTAGEEGRDHLDVYSLTGTGASTKGTALQLDQRDLGVPGGMEDGRGDDFGAALAVSELTGDAYADLVVGAPGEMVGDEGAGRVILVRGGANGLARSGNAAFDQESPGVPGGSEEGDDFGAAISLVDRDLDGRPDVVVGAPGKGDDGGRVFILDATGSGLRADREDYDLADYDYLPRGQAHYGAALA